MGGVFYGSIIVLKKFASMIEYTMTWRCRVGASEPVYALCPWGQKIPPINDRLEGGDILK